MFIIIIIYWFCFLLKDNMKKANGITIRSLATTNNKTNDNNNNTNNIYSNVISHNPYGTKDRHNHHKTTLPKIPIAALNTPVDGNNGKRTQFAPTFLPSILQTDREKYKVI